MKKIAVIGAGSWGTTIANLLAEKGNQISLWVHEKHLAEDIRNEGVNTTYLPDIKLSENINPLSDLEKALKDARYIVNAVPTQFTRGVFRGSEPFMSEDAVIVNASKGIEKGTLLTVHGIIKEITGRESSVLSGPSFAKEVIKKRPAAVAISCDDSDCCIDLQRLFNTDYFRVYTNHDIIGTELGGALKNVMAIASGISDGLGFGMSTRAALITRGLAEITRIGIAMGADRKTFEGLSGLGDLVLTCTGTLSRNYTVGLKLGKGEKLADILSGMTMVAEGVATSESAYELSKKENVEMPIVEQIYQVINESKDPHDAVKELMSRSLKSEY